MQRLLLSLSVLLIVGSLVSIPAPAKAAAPEPEHIPGIGVVLSNVSIQSSNEEVCEPGQAEIQPLNPVMHRVAVLNQPFSIFIPAALNGLPVQGEWCTDTNAYVGGNVLLSSEDIIPIVQGGKAAFQIGDLNTADLNYMPDQQLMPADMWNRLHTQMPDDLKGLKLLAAWKITDPEATTAQNPVLPPNEGPVDYPAVKDAWRARVMDDMIQSGVNLKFNLPTSVTVWRWPDKYVEISSGEYNARTMNTLCPGIGSVGSIQVTMQGFTVLQNQGPLQNEVTAWGFIQYPEDLTNLCGILNAYPWIQLGDAFLGLGYSDREAVDDAVDEQTIVWPKQQFSLFGNPALQPVPLPVMAEGTISAITWGAVVFVAAVFVVGAATGQFELWLLAFAVP